MSKSNRRALSVFDLIIWKNVRLVEMLINSCFSSRNIFTIYICARPTFYSC